MPNSRKLLWSVVAAVALAGRVGAQSDSYARGLELEQQEKYPEAASAYRAAIREQPASLPALLGLERVYAQLGHSDSLLPLLDSAIGRAPRVAALRTSQLRTFRALGDSERARAAFERWRREWPHDATPYREYARLLIQDGATGSADSILKRAQAELGSGRGLEYELAQLRAALGLWEQSATAWRDAVTQNAYLDQAATSSLAPTPPASREAVRRVLLASRDVGPRKVLSGLNLQWGASHEAWEALHDLSVLDTSVVHAWLDFARKAEESGAWLAARDALVAVSAEQPSADLLVRAASDALAGGDAKGAVQLATAGEAGRDSSSTHTAALSVHLRALAAQGKATEAQEVLASNRSMLPAEAVPRLQQLLAWAWVRAGDVSRARQLLAESGAEGDAEIRGWLSLYDGDLKTARQRLKGSSQTTGELVLALALLARTRADSAPSVGKAFLALARSDTVAAATLFERGAPTLPDAAPLLLAAAARLHTAQADDAHAIPLWQSVVEAHADAPEAPEAELEWSRALRRAKRETLAAEHLEHLILTYPQSALVPQARRELELARGTIPPTS